MMVCILGDVIQVIVYPSFKPFVSLRCRDKIYKSPLMEKFSFEVSLKYFFLNLSNYWDKTSNKNLYTCRESLVKETKSSGSE
jgi:hypothetical protein